MVAIGGRLNAKNTQKFICPPPRPGVSHPDFSAKITHCHRYKRKPCGLKSILILPFGLLPLPQPAYRPLRPARAPGKPRNGRNRHYQQHARHDRNQAKANHYRRRLPHLRSQINPDTILRIPAIQIATLQAGKDRKIARKTTKRPKSPPPTTRTPRKKPSHSTPPSTSIATFAVSNQS